MIWQGRQVDMAEKKKSSKSVKKKPAKKADAREKRHRPERKISAGKKQPEGKKTERQKQDKKKIIFTTGKRKRAVARASIRPGSGKVLINGELMDNMKNRTLRLRLMEPLIIAEKEWKSHDFNVNVRGGGILGQTDAARQAIAKGLAEIYGNDLRQKFLDYDRNLIAYDPRRTEPHKPPRSSQGPRRYKQRSKR